MTTVSPHRRHSSTPRKSSSFLGCVGGDTMPRVKLRPSMARKRSLFINYSDYSDGEDQRDVVDRPQRSALTDSVLNWKVEDVAAQLTLVSQATFLELQPCDLRSLKWYNPRMKNHPESLRVNEITRRFNYDGQWTVNCILREEVPRHRAEVMTHFIRVAKRLFELNNFHTSYAVFSALQSAPLDRLRHTRELLAKRDRVVLEDLASVFNPENNWQSFRDYQESAGFPRIPHIGFYKTDLIHAYHAYSNAAERDRRMAVIEQRVFDLFNRSNYGFLETPSAALQTYLKSLRYLEELQRFVDDENMKRSRRLEPDPQEKTVREKVQEAPPSSSSMLGSGGKKRSQVALESCETSVASSLDGGVKNKTTNLIDDSHIEAQVGLESLSLPSSAKHSLRFSSQSSSTSSGGNSLKSVPSLLQQQHFEWQGLLERKTVVRRGRFQYFPRWKRVWIAIWGVNLITYKPRNPFRASSRDHFQSTPATAVVLSGWKLLTTGALDVVEKSKIATLLEFTLISANSDTVLRLKTQNVTEYREWIKFLRGAMAKADHPANLISFDV
ncbi:putative Ras-specific guanine nucleotide-releasing factor RalGPS1 [Hypsibius exemplaris]|uniref:Ras-specific guanine nucleotide-releasing factor RalGPS1 n=1 Tax=Hypsibius exemplaris TaxID=2072580 RepID=A0A1W0WUM5_HYPEX|nr:putative Ras-specific guanine nucleotide-releasing factor RalGPS1 [Hypsibius exemplaris]